MSDLEDSLFQYRQQLQAVEAALGSAESEQRQDLLELKSNLLEVIKLIQDSSTTLGHNSSEEKNKETCADFQNNSQTSEKDIDAEFERFQSEMAELCGDHNNSNSNEHSNEMTNYEGEFDDGLAEIFSKMEGSRCRAPYSQEWGEQDYHNAIVLSMEVENQNFSSIEDIKVRVMFCNPICEAMKPCSYFMEGRCTFQDKGCRFSHGHIVMLSELQEFIDPDYSVLERDSICLAKYSDGLWYRAIIENLVSNEHLLVKYIQYDDTQSVGIEDILPISHQEAKESDESDSESDSSTSVPWMTAQDDSDAKLESNWMTAQDDSDAKLESNWFPTDPNARQFGQWEKHTRGIGSFLMAKMGYIWGQGLGKNSEGRTEPIEAVILPAGKSLDKCIEMREASRDKDHFKVFKRFEKIPRKQIEGSVNGFRRKKTPKQTVFDFINKKIGSVEGKKKTGLSENLKTSTNRGLSMQSFQISENILKAERELDHLEQALLRNKERKDRVMQEQLERRIVAQKKTMQNLRVQERTLNREQQKRKEHSKLTVF